MDEDLVMVGTEEPAVNVNETRQPVVIGVTTTVLSLATFFTILRIYVRAFILRKWGPDDSALVVSFVLVFLTGLLMLINTHYGDGLHVVRLSRWEYLKTQEIAIAAVALYQAAFPLIKSTFLLQYRRAFPLPPFQKLCNIFILFIITFGITQVVSICLACIPLRSLWDSTVPGRCIKLLDWWLIGSSINLVTDIVIFCMPLPLLQTLPLVMKQKVVLTAIFGLGFFTCAISVIRITTLKTSAASPDPTYNSVVAGVWSITELSCAIICVCVPTLRPLLGAQSPSSKTRNYPQRNIDDSADTELSNRFTSGVMSLKRRSKISYGGAQERIEDPENPRTVIEYARRFLGVTTPPETHVKETRGARAALRNDTAMTLPLARVDTEDGVGFLSIPGADREPELPTPLKPPPRGHIDKSNRNSEGGYFGAVVWDSMGRPSLPKSASSRKSRSPRDEEEDSSRSNDR
ncbi:pth11-like integral membrane protein [Colletotrichum truncatum]|uniref:Pth11-like integral membrane protein n=1 Tax=Colletotrichum truncatum TaxID=5467 RepID=A0ACC3YUK3_COLTU|nr:pth11-like integral membrane protein [Colletotrichum truncatum]KAF6780876.1 pth11-like integral membrane protein [Colletotrichum truncatum]